MDRKNEDVLLELVVEWLLALRAEYLTAGANAMTHWEHLQTRPQAAARTQGTLAEWIDATRRGLRLGAPTRDSSTCSLALLREARDQGWADATALGWIERRMSLVIARARERADERKARRESEATT